MSRLDAGFRIPARVLDPAALGGAGKGRGLAGQVEEGADHPDGASVLEAGGVFHRFQGRVPEGQGVQAGVAAELAFEDHADAEAGGDGLAHRLAAADLDALRRGAMPRSPSAASNTARVVEPGSRRISRLIGDLFDDAWLRRRAQGWPRLDEDELAVACGSVGRRCAGHRLQLGQHGNLAAPGQQRGLPGPRRNCRN